MTTEFIASTQYNDLTGTAAFDGHDGPGVHELAAMAEVPKEYFPIGFRLYRLDPGEDGLLPFQIIAVKKSETGDSMEKVVQAEKMTGHLRTYSLECKIDPRRFSAAFKRCEVVALARELDPNIRGKK